MCIHEQLETLHHTISAHTVWKRTKCECLQKLFCHLLFFSSKQDKKRKIIMKFSKHNISFFFKVKNLYLTLLVTAANHEASSHHVTSSSFLWMLFSFTPLWEEALAFAGLAGWATLGFLAPLVWCFPAGLCSQGSGTAPGWCTCLLAWSRKHQSSDRWLAPVKHFNNTRIRWDHKKKRWKRENRRQA